MMSLTAIGAHLWQSTLFAAVVGAATLMLRKNQAAIRHALWLAASIKFLVPFATLMALGAQFGPRSPIAVKETNITIVMNRTDVFPPMFLFSEPTAAVSNFAGPSVEVLGTIWLIGAVFVLGVWWTRWRCVASIARAATTIETGEVLDALRRIEREAGLKRPIRLVESTASLEPGVFGLIRPMLVWPRAIGAHLNEQQVVAILAHEVAHVRRRDNLTAAIHMTVESVFWFHPLVWWLGARLVDERERACDEAVLRLGSEPEVYAETILKACRMVLESPVTCVSGITGSDLRQRIERIMLNASSEALTPMKKLFVAAVPVAALVVPIVIGVLDAPRLRAESRRLKVLAPASIQGPAAFDVASVKPNKTGIAKVSIQTIPGGRFTAENVTLRMLIRNAFQLQDSQLSGGPKWLDEDRFDIVAKTPSGDELGDPFKAEQIGQPSRGQLMLRALLAERFKLQVHTERREMSTYALVQTRRDGTLGPQLQRSDADCSAPDADRREPPSALGVRQRCGLRLMPGSMTGGGASMSQLANSLAAFVGRIVFDRTGLAGDFDFTLKWTPDHIPQGFEKKAAAMNLPPVDDNGPSIFTALQEQLGLKLDAQKAPVEVLIIDRAEHPIEN